MASHQQFPHSNPYHLPPVADAFSVYNALFFLNFCNDMHQQVPVMLLFIDKCFHAYYISPTDCLCLSSKMPHKGIVLQVLDRDGLVMLLPMEAKKIPLVKNMKGHQYQYVPLILNLIQATNNKRYNQFRNHLQ